MVSPFDGEGLGPLSTASGIGTAGQRDVFELATPMSRQRMSRPLRESTTLIPTLTPTLARQPDLDRR